jgi:RNA polymerase sigma factor (sigma-70 family)
MAPAVIRGRRPCVFRVMMVELAVTDDGGGERLPSVARARRWRGGHKVVPTVQSVAGSDLRSLFDSHYAPMVRLATVMLGHNAAAEDVVQQAFVALDRRLSGLRPGAEAAYLRTSVVNGCRSHVRAGRARKRQLVLVREGSPPLPEDEAVRDEKQRAVLAAIDALPRRQRECVVLRYYLGLADREIAETLGLALGSAKTHLRRGQHALAGSLEGLR